MTAGFVDPTERGLPVAVEPGGLTGSGSSDDGLVTATVDGGRLQALTLDPKVMRNSGAELGRAVVAAVGRARAEHEELRARRTAELGAQRPDRAAVLQRLERLQQLVRDSDGDMRTVADRMHADAVRDARS